MTINTTAARELARILCRASVLRLNANSLHALCILHAMDGAATMTALSRKLGVSTAGITGIADGLEAAGLIARHLSRSDRRLVYVHLTDKGTLALDDILNA
jgi:DNA-binding MarR family transcriptional regulator